MPTTLTVIETMSVTVILSMTMNMTPTLTETETALWESDDAIERDDFRAEIRASMESGEIYSHDGITLDAWDVQA